MKGQKKEGYKVTTRNERGEMVASDFCYSVGEAIEAVVQIRKEGYSASISPAPKPEYLRAAVRKLKQLDAEGLLNDRCPVIPERQGHSDEGGRE